MATRGGVALLSRGSMPSRAAGGSGVVIMNASTTGVNLIINAGAGSITLGSTVGATNALSSVSLTSSTQIKLGGSVSTSGSQTYTGPVVLNTDITTTTSGGGVVFASTLNSIAAAAKTLTMTLGSGNATLGGVVGGATGGALGSLSVTTSGTLAINGGIVTTTGAQTYSSKVT